MMGVIVDRIGARQLVQMAMISVVCDNLIFALFDGLVASAGLALIGFSLAPIFPTLMALTPRRFGANLAPHVIGYQVSAAMLGAVVLPTVAGYLADLFSLKVVFPLALMLALMLTSFNVVLTKFK